MSRPLRLAFLGCGFITRVHSRHLKALADDGWIAARAEGTSNLYAMRRNSTASGRDELDQSARRLWSLVRDAVAPTPAAVEDQRRIDAVVAERRTRSQEFFSSSATQWDRLRDEMFGEGFHWAALAAFARSGVEEREQV